VNADYLTATILLRDYQEEMIARGRQRMSRGVRRILFQLATGGGKTVLAIYLLVSAAKKGNNVWFIVPLPDLVSQTVNSFRKFGVEVGVVCAGWAPQPFMKIQVCSLPTLRNRHTNLPPPDMIVWDESHHLPAKSWTALFDHYAQVFHILLSATPGRADGQGLARYADEMIQGPPVRELMDRGYLSDYRLYAPSAPDMRGVHSQGGEFIASEADAAMKKSVVTGDIIRHHQKLARGLKTFLFAPSIKSSKEYAQAFMEQGIVAVHADGTTSKGDRMVAFKGLAAGHIEILCSVGIVGEGVDLAALAGEDVTVEALIDACPTKSLNLWLQRIGRVLRPKPEKAVILDHSGNSINRFGFPDDEREWSLDAKPKQAKKKKDEEPTVTTATCATCFYVMPLRVTTCPGCGTERVTKGRKVEMVDGELEELDVARLRDEKKRREGEELKAARTFDQLVDLFTRWGRKRPEQHAARILSERELYRQQRNSQRRVG
jgi:superfamily II DNA or RNA helicase